MPDHECSSSRVFRSLASSAEYASGETRPRPAEDPSCRRWPPTRGLLWVASDGNLDLQPDAVWFLLTRILQKKRENGTPYYSNIHGLAYFSPRMLVEMPQSKQPALFWFNGSRQADDQQMAACLNELCTAWPQHVAREQRIVVRQVDGKTVSPENLRFLGVPPRMPKIQVSDPCRAEGHQNT